MIVSCISQIIRSPKSLMWPFAIGFVCHLVVCVMCLQFNIFKFLKTTWPIHFKFSLMHVLRKGNIKCKFYDSCPTKGVVITIFLFFFLKNEIYFGKCMFMRFLYISVVWQWYLGDRYGLLTFCICFVFSPFVSNIDT